MLSGSDDRMGALDRVLDEAYREHVSAGEGVMSKILSVVPGVSSPADQSLAADLFTVADALASSAALRRAFTDPSMPVEARKRLAHSLLDRKVSKAAANVVAEAAGMRWAGGRDFAAAVERQAVRADLLAADAAGQLGDTEDALFRFARLVESSPELRNTLSDRTIPVENRQELVGNLLEGKASESTIRLAKRAVLASERTYGHTIEGYVTMAAAHRNRLVATVRVAKPLTQEQISRLQTALSTQVGRDVAVQIVIDESVLGGVRVELGDEIIEGTVADRLADAKRLFS